MTTWPPELSDLKSDMANTNVIDDRNDAKLTLDLDAAIAYVERVRGADINFAAVVDSTLPDPTDDLFLGTLRLAVRYGHRRKSPDGLVSFGNDLGSGRVPSWDSDIEQLLGVGHYAPLRFS